MSRRKVIVIGGGVSGLATGCYLRMNGYETEVLEMGSQLGGVSVSWKRKGYTFDGATSWLPGSTPSLNLHPILREVLDFDELEFVDLDVFLEIDVDGGRPFRIYTDVERLRAEMLEMAPEDRKVIDEFVGAVRRAPRLPIPVEKPPEFYGLSDVLRGYRTLVPLQLFIMKWRGQTIDSFAGRFGNPRMRRLFKLIFHRHEYFSVLGLILALGWMSIGSAGHPLGGSRKLVGLLAKKYSSLEGKATCNARVDEIIVRDGSARGVKLGDGTTREADIVVSACDVHQTVHGMLGGRYRPGGLLRNLEGLRVFPSNIQVSIGIARTFEGEPHRILLPFDPPLAVGSDKDIGFMLAILSTLDPDFAPQGKSAVVVQVRTHDHERWQALRESRRPEYEAEKDRVALAVVKALETRFGELRSRIEVIDVATPATYIRYTGVWKGSYQGWAPTPEVIGRKVRKTIPGLSDFYMAGQWVDPPGGLPRVILSGRNLAQIICRDDGRPFVVS